LHSRACHMRYFIKTRLPLEGATHWTWSDKPREQHWFPSNAPVTFWTYLIPRGNTLEKPGASETGSDITNWQPNLCFLKISVISRCCIASLTLAYRTLRANLCMQLADFRHWNRLLWSRHRVSSAFSRHRIKLSFGAKQSFDARSTTFGCNSSVACSNSSCWQMS
jgi:hypothetical protein